MRLPLSTLLGASTLIVIAGCGRSPEASRPSHHGHAHAHEHTHAHEEGHGQEKHEHAEVEWTEQHALRVPKEVAEEMGLQVGSPEVHPIEAVTRITGRVTGAISDTPSGPESAQVTGWVREEVAASLSTGTLASIETRQGQRLEGGVAVVHRVLPGSGGLERELLVRVETRGIQLAAGDFVDIILPGTVASVLSVPVQAVVRTVEGDFVYRVRDGLFHRSPIQAGRRDLRRVEVVHGLEVEDPLVLAGTEALWRCELSFLRGGGHHGHAH
ncbi:MAG: hypothetical protein FJ404_08225 [Verrucomicrobia bacterium]|nr:hypothetical protein [Verrucomicrobiota bacterium]